jgi:hypothetical protein
MQRRQLLQAASLLATLPSWAANEATPYEWRSLPFGGGGLVTGLVFHPREKGLLYARADNGGAYRFDATGRRWVPLLDHLGRADAELMTVLSLAVDPTDANRGLRQPDRPMVARRGAARVQRPRRQLAAP